MTMHVQARIKTKNQILIRLDQESSSEQLKSLEQSSKDKTIQLTQKNRQLKLKKAERRRTTELNIEQINTTNRRNMNETRPAGESAPGTRKRGACSYLFSE